MSEETIQLSVADAVATIRLNRPERLNSFNTRMHEEMRSALDRVAEDPDIRCVLLTGNGRGFCAGQDLSDRAVSNNDERPDLSQSLIERYNPMIRSLTGMAKPVVCAVNGVAAGAGANIALACDIVLAARSASFIQAFCKIGLMPDAGGTWTLPNLVGRSRAMGLALLGDKLSAEQAEQWGLIWRCVDDDQLGSEAEQLCTHLASQPTVGLAAIKRAINASAANSLDQQLDLEAEQQGQLGRTDDYREGVRAFVEKRPPVFKGQ